MATPSPSAMHFKADSTQGNRLRQHKILLPTIKVFAKS